MINTPQQNYQDLKSKYSTELNKITTQIKRISILRISVFLVGIIAIYFAAGYTALHVWTVAIVFGLSFTWIVYYHVRLHKKKDVLARLLQINENEISAMSSDYSCFDAGAEFLNPGHPYAADLDIFGKGSIFQYLNRTSTIIGKKMLADWFASPDKKQETIDKRHDAISDLKNRVSWRQNFQSVGIWLKDSEDDKNGILDWMSAPAEFKGIGFRFILWLVPVASTFALLMFIFGHINFQLFTLYMFVPLGIAFSQAKKVLQKHEMLSKKAELLDKYGRLLTMIDQEKFDSKVLNEIKKNLTQEHNSGMALQKLSKIIHAFDSRLNIFAWVILNYFAVWDILQSRRLEKWRATYSKDAVFWFDVLAQFDALNSLACFYYNRPDFILPRATRKTFTLEAENCGHPLINPKTRIDNPISFDGWKQFKIVTGANMAGKSTYLRTVAVNFVLAMTGAPVCATKFVFSPADIFTSILTRDDLLHNESYFFAELKRLKAIIDKLESGSKLFIILDEILKGTNSKDKQEGSKALLKQLIRYDSSGLIATHDLTLGELIKEYPANIRNNRFEVEIENDELVFDYTLKEGISQNLNATFLMKKMGITI